MSDNWFSEKEVMWPGQRFSLQVKNIIHEEKSEFQDIMVFDSETYGRVLVLDGVIQLTERDEFAYQESIVHLPMFAHPNPKNVLIVGGGDGGVLREVCRHPGVEKVVMCEIDQRVVAVAKQYFSNSTAVAYDDPRVTLLFMDAAKYMAEHKNEFDVIIVDSSDPMEGGAVANTLFTPAFYQDMHDALRENGVIATQGECQFLHLDLINRVMSEANKIYPVVDYAYSSVPTYPSGQIGYILATKHNGSKDYLRTPKRAVPESMKPLLRYYTSEVHKSCFVLPKFSADKLADVRAPQEVKKACPLSCAGKVAGYVAAFAAGAAVAAIVAKKN